MNRMSLRGISASAGAAILAALSTVNQVLASTGNSTDDWSGKLGDQGGFVKMFNSIGGVYIKWAWFAGIIGILGWLFTRADEKKSAVFKGIAIGVMAGYIVFAIGGDNWFNVFSAITGWFPGGSN